MARPALSGINNRGIVLFIVLATIVIVVILANILFSIILNEARITHHQVSRIKAYYAAMAGVNLAFDKLRTGVWGIDSVNSRYYCINGNVDSGVSCLDTFSDSGSSGIPYNVQIRVYPQGSGLRNTARIDCKVSYTYNP